MDNAGVQKKQTGDTASVFSTVWDPFWFVRQVLGWGRSGDAPSFDVTETDDTFVCKVKLALPDRADVANAKAKLDNGELTLVVPKAAAAAPEPESPPKRTRRATGKSRGSAGRARGRGAGTRARPG